MNSVRKILLVALGEKRYLTLLANAFQNAYKKGLPGKDYQDVYFLKQLLNQGDYCIDIGAHLGYYTCELSKLIGPSGKVFAIEPMSIFHNVLRTLLKRKRITNVELYQLAMGGDSEFVEMGIPRLGNMKKFAYARVMQSSTHLEYTASEKVKNASGDELFAELPRLDFIKCDVEGLEVPVFTSMMNSLAKYKPMILCELPDRNERIRMYQMLLPLGYQCYLLSDKKLRHLDVYSDRTAISHNHYFIPTDHEKRLKDLITF